MLIVKLFFAGNIAHKNIISLLLHKRLKLIPTNVVNEKL